MTVEILPIMGVPEIAPNADLGGILSRALRESASPLGVTDVLVVTQKIVSKWEGRFIDLGTVLPSAAAMRLAEIVRKDARLVELILSESAAILRAVPGVLITRHRTGHVMANAGIDRSNLGGAGTDMALLLPEDSDASAERLRAQITRDAGVSLAVVIADSFGRPWRNGVVNVAIGSAGLPSLIDRRGNLDRDGRPLEVTQIGLADLLACAAGLVMGEASEGVPAALVRGIDVDAPCNPASSLIRSLDEDLFQ